MVGNKIYLRCYSKICKGRAIQNGAEYRITTAHDEHPNHNATIVKFRFRDRLRAAVIANPEKTPGALFEQEQLINHDAAELVGREDVRNLLAKSRKKMVPPIPTDLKDLGAFLDTER